MSVKKRPGRPPKWKNGRSAGVYLPSHMLEQLDEIARKYGISRSELLAKIISEYLKIAVEKLEAEKEEQDQEVDELDQALGGIMTIQIKKQLGSLKQNLEILKQRYELYINSIYDKDKYKAQIQKIINAQIKPLEDVYNFLKKYDYIISPKVKKDAIDLIKEYKRIAEEILNV